MDSSVCPASGLGSPSVVGTPRQDGGPPPWPPIHPGTAVRWRPREGTDWPWGHQGAIWSCEDPAPGSWQLFSHPVLPRSHFWGTRLERQGESDRLPHLGPLLHIVQDQFVHYWICSYRIKVSTLCPNCPPVSLLFSSSLDPAANPDSQVEMSWPQGGQGPESSPLCPALLRRAGHLALDLGPHTWLGYPSSTFRS